MLFAVVGLAAASFATVTPKAAGDDKRLGQPCALEALSQAGRIRGEPGMPLELEPGTWALALVCPDPSGHPVLLPGPVRTLAPGERAEARFTRSAAPVRVEATRGGQRIQADVELISPGLDAPWLRFSSQETVWVGRGRWNIRVSGEGATVTRPMAQFRPGRRTTVFDIDLSDGAVRVDARLDGRPAKAAVRPVDEEGRPLAPATPAESAVALPPGSHRLEIALLDAADFQTERRLAVVEPGRTSRLRVDFTGGTLDVALTRDGASLPAPVHVRRPGAGKAFLVLESPGRALLRPGLYQLTVHGPAAGPTRRHELPPATVGAKRTAVVRADLSPAEVRVNEKASELVLREAGGGPVVPPTAPGVWRPWAGRYELERQGPSGKTLVDGPFEVGLGERVVRDIADDDAELRVDARRRGAPVKDAQVRVFRPGAGAPVLARPAAQWVPLEPGRYDVEVSSGDAVNWRRGVEVFGRVTLVVDIEPEEELPEGDAD